MLYWLAHIKRSGMLPVGHGDCCTSAMSACWCHTGPSVPHHSCLVSPVPSARANPAASAGMCFLPRRCNLSAASQLAANAAAATAISSHHCCSCRCRILPSLLLQNPSPLNKLQGCSSTVRRMLFCVALLPPCAAAAADAAVAADAVATGRQSVSCCNTITSIPQPQGPQALRHVLSSCGAATIAAR